MGSRELSPLFALVAHTALVFFIKLPSTLEVFFNLIFSPCLIEEGVEWVRKHPGGFLGTSQDQPTSPFFGHEIKPVLTWAYYSCGSW